MAEKITPDTLSARVCVLEERMDATAINSNSIEFEKIKDKIHEIKSILNTINEPKFEVPQELLLKGTELDMLVGKIIGDGPMREASSTFVDKLHALKNADEVNKSTEFIRVKLALGGVIITLEGSKNLQSAKLIARHMRSLLIKIASCGQEKRVEILENIHQDYEKLEELFKDDYDSEWGKWADELQDSILSLAVSSSPETPKSEFCAALTVCQTDLREIINA